MPRWLRRRRTRSGPYLGPIDRTRGYATSPYRPSTFLRLTTARPDRTALLTRVADAAAAILNPARGDASWLHTAEFDRLRAALSDAGYDIVKRPHGPVSSLPTSPESH